MIKKEAIKQAVDAIAARDSEIGYSLLELFGTGRIDIVEEAEPLKGEGLYHFSFDGRKIPIKKINYFYEGPAAIEQSLVIQYGEMEQQQSLASSIRSIDYATANETIQMAGLRRLVRYEVNRAYDLLGQQATHRQGANLTMEGSQAESRKLLDQLQDELRMEEELDDFPRDGNDERVLFSGAVNADTPAFFISFPYTRKSLIQAAGLNLTFFSVRFILGCLLNGTARQLFSCLVEGTIVGMVFLRIINKLAYKALEIKYIASAREAVTASLSTRPAHRGVGTFLVAGVWLLWKNRMPDAREVVLDAEIQALGFYEEIGFERRRSYLYALVRPAGYLLNALVVMVDRSRFIDGSVIQVLIKLIRAQVQKLAHQRAGAVGRSQSLAFIRLCLLSQSKPQLAQTAALALLKHQARIPETDDLIQMAATHGRIKVIEKASPLTHPLLVFKHADLGLHLKGIFHLENVNRLKAIDEVLDEAPMPGKWIGVGARRVAEKELAWVHTAEHIARIAATAGKPLASIDLDTQTTQDSFSVATLAVGGIFSLLDAIFTTPSRRGFAAVRPPGHHAEPGRAMGFCLFNNVAMGACYLRRVMGLKRVMIIDIDAHHGNGTQAAFYDSSEVLFISMHQFPCYPGSGNFGEVGRGPGEGYSVNVPLNKGMGDFEFVQVMFRLAAPLARVFEPEMILVSCGFDLYQYDRLAGLNGTPEGYAMMTHLLCRIADEVCDGRIAFIMEGGYSVQGIRDCGRKVLHELCYLPTSAHTRLEKYLNGSTASFPALQKAMAIHAKYWPVLKG